MSCSQVFWTRLLWAFLLSVSFAAGILYWIGNKIDPVSHLRRKIYE